MMKFPFRSTMLLFLILGCQQTKNTPRTVGISEVEAVKAAKLAFSKLRPGKLPHYSARATNYPEDGEWHVWFKGLDNYLVPGSEVMIAVDKKSGKVRVPPK
jgi:hypothetical protein